MIETGASSKVLRMRHITFPYLISLLTLLSIVMVILLSSKYLFGVAFSHICSFSFPRSVMYSTRISLKISESGYACKLLFYYNVGDHR